MFGFIKPRIPQKPALDAADEVVLGRIEAQAEMNKKRDADRARAFELMRHHVVNIGLASDWNRLNNALGVGIGYYNALFDTGVISKEEAIEQHNHLVLAVNIRSQALMLDIVFAGGWRH